MSTSWMLSVAMAGVATGLLAQGSPQKDSTPAAKDPLQLVAEGRKMVSSGKLDEGMASIDKALATDPKLFEGLLAKGIALDIKGDYPGARKFLEDANAVAQDDARDPVFTAIAVSYVFEGDVANAARYYQRLFDRYIAASRIDTAAEIANALARVYLETGDIAKAEQWYTTGRENAKKLSGLREDQVDLWTMRWHHAASRIASRKGDHKTAAREAAVVKQLVDKNQQNATQMPIYLYLAGYNALYAKQYDEAIAVLQKADLRDPFILGLLAQAYEKKRDVANAKATWTKALETYGHSVQNALTRPLAKKRLASLK
jgi:tetratricopeptide (TPR) repeat protein